MRRTLTNAWRGGEVQHKITKLVIAHSWGQLSGLCVGALQ